MPRLIWPLVPLIIPAMLLNLAVSACALPQDVGAEGQVLRGAEDPAATFAVQYVTRDTLPVLDSWPDSHPGQTLGWITHQRTSPDPLIEAGDRLSLAVWDNDDTSLLSQPAQKVIQLPDLRVSSAGTVFLPYVDEVYVAKMTPDQARKAIQAKLLSIIPSAQVQLSFTSGRKNSVDLVSGVPNPGSFPLPERDLTVTSLLALGGGVALATGNPQVRLSRDGKLYGISAETLLTHPDLDTTVRGGDKIFVQPDQRYFLSLGAAGRETLIGFSRDHVSALDAMAIIGGVNQTTANPKGILILRDYPQSAVRSDSKGPGKDRMIFAMDLTTADGLFSAGNFPIEDHDLILVTQSPLINARTVFGLIGSVFGLVRSANDLNRRL